jgi:hypothetical protein
MPGAHAPIAPSSLARTVQCPASVGMSLRYPEAGQGADAAAGDASHWVGQMALSAGYRSAAGEQAPNGMTLDAEMIEGAEMYADEVLHTAAERGIPRDAIRVEKPVQIPRIHAQCWGTPDAHAWVMGGPPTLLLWDYKFGHRWVDEFENWQLMAYAIGAISATGYHDLEVTVEARIVQPRAFGAAGPIRVWRFAASDVRAMVNIAAMAATEALGPEPRMRVGPECRDCLARHACPALQRAAQDACDQAMRGMPIDLDEAALGLELRLMRRAQDLLAARVDALEQQALSLVRSGKRVPHWRPDRSSGGRTVWKRTPAEVIALGDLMGIDLRKPVEPVTPRQAEQRGLQAALVSNYAEHRPGALCLVPDDGSDMRRAFAAQKNFPS